MYFWKCIQYTIHWGKTNVKDFPSNKINGTKNALFFFCDLQFIQFYFYTLKVRFLYELKRKIRLSKTVCGILHFRFRFVFIKVYLYFCLTKGKDSLTLKRHAPFKIKIMQKPRSVLLPNLGFLSWKKKF